MTIRSRIYFLLSSLAALSLASSSCGSIPDMTFDSLLEHQPYVTKMAPPPQSVLEVPVKLTLTFSERISFNEIQPESIALLKGEIDPIILHDTKQLINEIQSGVLPQQEAKYFLSDDETVLTLSPTPPLQNGIYHVAVTPKLKSVSGIPFNQHPGEKPTAYVAPFTIGKELGDSSEESSPQYGPEPEWLMIHEILYDGVESEADGEAFIELYGEPGTDISGYSIHLINGANGAVTNEIAFPAGTLIPDDGIFVIADLRTGSTESTRVIHFDMLDQFDPQNGPDAVHLLNRESILLDALAYGEGGVSIAADGRPTGEGSPASDVKPGHSLSRLSGSDTQDNHLDFIDFEIPTPGVL